jgi:hypothetical protein
MQTQSQSSDQNEGQNMSQQDKELTFRHKQVYGKDLFYPVCEPSKTLVNKLMRQLTLDQYGLSLVEGMGLKVRVMAAWQQVTP